MLHVSRLQWFMALQCGRECFKLHILIQATLLILLLLLPAVSSSAISPSHAQAVALARSDRLPEAITMLEELRQRHPQDKKIINDLIVIYNWNRQYKQACLLFEEQEANTYPTYVQTAALSAYRNLQQPEQALAIAESLLQQQPDTVDLLLYSGLLFVDLQRMESARVILDVINSTNGKDSNYYRLSGRLHSAEKNRMAALADYQQLSRLLPQDQAAIREQFSALQYVRSSEAAAKILNRHEQFFTTHDQAMLLINKAAEKLRWSTDAASDFTETRIFAMQALSMQIKALELLTAETNGKSWPTPVLSDIIVSLRNLRQMDNVEAVYRYLSENGNVPDYVKHAAAGAMLANKHPDKSRELYQQILEHEPNSHQAQTGLFYSFVEEENFDDAYELIDRIFEKEPVYQTYNDKKYRTNNERRLDLNVYAIQVRFYGDQLADAWVRIDELIRNAPANNWLYEVRGQVNNGRAWYRQALYDYHYATLLAPDSLDAFAGEVSSHILLRQYEQARPLLATIQDQYPDEYASKSVAKEWKFSRKPEYWADIIYGNSSGPEFDGDAMTATAEILSSPIHDNLYLDASYRYAWAQIIEGEETFKRYALGMDYHLMDWDFQGRVTSNDSSLDEIGGKVKVLWNPDDFWNLTLAGERFSVDTPLRALYHRIRADSISATANYRWSEQRELFVKVQGSSFTDNNERVAGTAILRQRLVDVPHFDLDGRVEVYGSTNSHRNAPYYNPEQDFSLKGALHLDHVYFRHYDHLLVQMIDVGYGVYEQKGYGSRWVGHIRYEQRYKFTPWVEMLAGVEFGQSVYDGQAEPYQLVRFMITGKF